MIIGIGNQFQDLRRPKGPTTPLNGLGFLELQNTTDLLLQEAAP
jgi:hypothetical protein